MVLMIPNGYDAEENDAVYSTGGRLPQCRSLLETLW